MPDDAFSGRLSLAGTTALVTGAAMGLGAGVARRLGALGARIAILDRDAEAAAAAAAALRESGVEASSETADVADETAVQHALERLRASLGAIDILANCAGVVSAPGMPYSKVSAQDFERVFAVNVTGMFNTAKACREDLVRSPAGRIVNLSSITGVISAPYMPAYSVSKAAVISLTKVLARDLAPHHVTVNAVCPGFIWTPLWETLGTVMAKDERQAGDAPVRSGRDVFDDRIHKHVPMQREQSADDVADCVAFLCSGAAANITGQVIGVDGGITI